MKELRRNLLEDDPAEEKSKVNEAPEKADEKVKENTDIKVSGKAQIQPAASTMPIAQGAMMPGPKKKKKVWPWVLIIVLVITGGIAATVIPMIMNMPKGMEVETATAFTGSVEEKMSFSGTVQSAETKTYFAPVAGKLSSVNLKEGDIIKAGDLLVTYDVSDLEEQARSTELQAKAEDLGIDATIIGINKQYADYVDNENKYNEAKAYLDHWSYCLEMSNREYSEAMAVKTEYETIKEKVDALKIQQADKKDNPNPEIARMIEEEEAKLPPLQEKMAQYDYVALAGSVETCSAEMNEYKALVKQYEAQRELNPALPKQKEQQQVLDQINDLSVESIHEKIDKAKAGIVADFGGLVSEAAVTDGQSVTEGMQLFTVKSMDRVCVLININKNDLKYVSEGMKATVDLNGNEYEGTLTKINREAKAAANGGVSTITGEVMIDSPDENVYLGIEAKVFIEKGSEKDAVLVPVTAVNYDSKGTMCYIVNSENKVERREVVTGLASDETIQIVTGINVGDVVITEVDESIQEDMEVRIKEEEDDKDGKDKDDKGDKDDKDKDSDKDSDNKESSDDKESDEDSDKDDNSSVNVTNESDMSQVTFNVGAGI